MLAGMHAGPGQGHQGPAARAGAPPLLACERNMWQHILVVAAAVAVVFVVIAVVRFGLGAGTAEQRSSGAEQGSCRTVGQLISRVAQKRKVEFVKRGGTPPWRADFSERADEYRTKAQYVKSLC